jgi:hypothetical protein
MCDAQKIQSSLYIFLLSVLALTKWAVLGKGDRKYILSIRLRNCLVFAVNICPFLAIGHYQWFWISLFKSTLFPEVRKNYGLEPMPSIFLHSPGVYSTVNTVQVKDLFDTLQLHMPFIYPALKHCHLMWSIIFVWGFDLVFPTESSVSL